MLRNCIRARGSPQACDDAPVSQPRPRRTTIAEWRQDFNTARPHFSFGYQTPAALAGTLAATGSDAALNETSRLRRLLKPRNWMKVQGQVSAC
ncbi:integrase core domain-containing protein [Mesorhizobium captivum]|uniref:integrase core domain-containing protein n=1 Tax=Mesorhizobium captivum TaxID=3072319 RepID=UPI003D31C0CF